VDEALVIDHAAADVANHDDLPLAAVGAGDVLLVHYVAPTARGE
jgi:hypothetical protein